MTRKPLEAAGGDRRRLVVGLPVVLVTVFARSVNANARPPAGKYGGVGVTAAPSAGASVNPSHNTGGTVPSLL